MARSHDPQQKMLDLLAEVLAIARQLAPLTTAQRHGPAATKSPGAGIYPHTSKYNPWRAYVWDRAQRRSIYLGAFPSITKARAAQRDYRAGQPVEGGTRAALRRVA